MWKLSSSVRKKGLRIFEGVIEGSSIVHSHVDCKCVAQYLVVKPIRKVLKDKELKDVIPNRKSELEGRKSGLMLALQEKVKCSSGD